MEIHADIGEEDKQEAIIEETGSRTVSVYSFSASFLELLCSCLCMFVCSLLQLLNLAFVLFVVACVLLGTLFMRLCMCRCRFSILMCMSNLSGCTQCDDVL
jgi:hypothetical protein